MRLRMWMYDLAREQFPTHEFLRHLCQLTFDAGYNALGLYLEHRFAYPSSPWTHGVDALTPAVVASLQSEFPALQIIPFVNLLGHFEGTLYSSGGDGLAEQRFAGMQGCPSNAEFLSLCEGLIDDTLAAFQSEIVHIGGDETWQLGACPKCAARASEPDAGKSALYGEHMGRLARRVVAAGRRPAVWADMFFEHPSALGYLPPETILFDWQYFSGPRLSPAGSNFEIVTCPALHTYNAAWMHLPQSESNIREHVQAAKSAPFFGLCLTTWEAALFGNYATMLPAIVGAGKLINQPNEGHSITQTQGGYDRARDASALLDGYRVQGEPYAEWAQLMGVELLDCGPLFRFSQTRSSLKCRLLLYSNPFLLWLRNRDDLLSEDGDRAHVIAQRAAAVAPNANMRGVSEFVQLGIEFVRHVEATSRHYSAGDVGLAIRALAPCRQVFEALERIARGNHVNSGGSLADIERCIIARRHVELVIARIKLYGDGSLGYRPSFEMISHPKFVPHDQAGWWLINRWANE